MGGIIRGCQGVVLFFCWVVCFGCFYILFFFSVGSDFGEVLILAIQDETWDIQLHMSGLGFGAVEVGMDISC